MKISLKDCNGWAFYEDKTCKTKLWLKGYFYGKNKSDIVKDLAVLNDDKESLINYVKSLDGHYAIVVSKNHNVYAFSDRVGSHNLFYTTGRSSEITLTDEVNALKPFDPSEYDELAELEIIMSGYTIGSKTLFRNIKRLQAGEVLHCNHYSNSVHQYYYYFGFIERKTYFSYLKELYEVTCSVFDKLLKDVGERQIVVPLSAGNDSRLVASILHYLGATNVLCYSYGSKNNFEAAVAESVAKKLGFKWVFIPLTHSSEKSFYSSSDFQKYKIFSETLSSVPYIQSLSSLKYLKELEIIDDDAVFINGNSGDFISGGHITPLMRNHHMSAESDRIDNVFRAIFNKHFSLWGYKKTNDNLGYIRKSLEKQFLAIGGLPEEREKDHLLYEYSELMGRQSKYVISGQKVYEFYGYDWRMPLWSNELLEFWAKVPAEYKVNQKLYLDMLCLSNFGGVWDEKIPINKKTITPKWVIPLRFMCKIPFGLLGASGRKRWHFFEKAVFNYWMDVTHMHDTTSYFRMVKDIFKKPRNHVSWHAEDYIKETREKI
ncbi:hypothetical protein BZG20_03475 [Salinivibrio sp. IB868]|uniref:asparagine synthase-related protein n=1 Tax=Salinivibrio sp. IB868 TaxID=1909447 RepID=UPI000985E74F|nr:asparagine synthase-related protein [Salinivibrio sp. IB868]OOE68978.1 hypothetical protein BZG20_03475 [Salinivibrio sp. IB868]